MIYGVGGALKCPADSHQKNGFEVYSKFLDAVKEFEELQSLPVNVDFKGEDKADLFMANPAKWHKSCHLKFASSTNSTKACARMTFSSLLMPES